MSLSDTVNSFGRDISAGFSPNGVCGFAPSEQTYGFIDTSLSHDGSRGIAFLKSGLCVNLYGTAERMSYESITARLVESYESGYADELILDDGEKEIRVSDYSLNKPFLKLLVETLCLRCKQSARPTGTELPPSAIPEINSRNAPDVVYSSPDEHPPEPAGEIYAPTNEPTPEPAGEIYAPTNEPAPEPAGEIYAPTNEPPPEPAGEIYAPTNEPAPEPAGEIYAPTDEPAPEPAGEIYAPTNEPAPEPAGEIYAPSDEPAPEPAGEIYAPTPEPPPEPAGEIYTPLDKPASENVKPILPEGYVPPEIPEEKIRWISGSDADEELSGENMDALEGMSTEETLSFLVNSIREINTKPDDSMEDELDDELSEISVGELRSAPPVIPEYSAKASPISEKGSADTQAPLRLSDEQPVRSAADINTPKSAREEPAAPAVKAPPASLFTKEPPSDDVYITASAKLREACESGKLSPETIDAEIKGELIPAAKAFMEVIARADVPKALAPRIAELRAASAKIKDYFAIGEDVAARVMFFMLYQMLSYSDRIVEDAATKERLNGFFKRCGSSMITLSMLDIWTRQQ